MSELLPGIPALSRQWTGQNSARSDLCILLSVLSSYPLVLLPLWLCCQAESVLQLEE